MSSLLFVHIAKAGGTSLRRLLKSHEGISRFDCFHNGFLLRFENGRRVGIDQVQLNSLDKYDLAVIALRHPLARLQSCYRYFLSGGLNGRGKGVFPDDLRKKEFLNSVAPSFSDCCQKLTEISGPIPHFRPASVWFDSLVGPPAKSLVCCRQESFSADVNGFLRVLGLPPSSGLEHRNKGLASSSMSVSSDLADLRLVEDFYRNDYSLFGYESCQSRSLPLVQYWNELEPPFLVAERMDSWKSLNPGWDYRRFDRQTAADFLRGAYGLEIAAAFLDIRLPAMQADVFRVGFLLHCGGLWVDAATSIIRPVDTWIDRRHSLQMLRRDHQEYPKIATQIIYAARPDMPLLRAVWNEIVPRLLSRSGTKVYRHFGPGLFRDLMISRPSLALGLHVISESSARNSLLVGSSSSLLPAEQHWTKRQECESLYISGE